MRSGSTKASRSLLLSSQNRFPNSVLHASHSREVPGVCVPDVWADAHTPTAKRGRPSPHHHSPEEGLPSSVVHHVGVTDVHVHPLAPPELHQAAEPHAGVPEPPGRVQGRAHGLGALEQQLRSPGSIGAPRPVQAAAQRDRALERVPVRRGRPASVADVTVEVIEAVPREG